MMIENAWRCYMARACLWRLKAARMRQAAGSIQHWWRNWLMQRRLRLLRRIASRLMVRGRQNMRLALQKKWDWVLKERRRLWLDRFARLSALHLAAILLQRHVRYYLRLGRTSFMQHVTSKLHFSVRRLVSTPSSQSPAHQKEAALAF